MNMVLTSVTLAMVQPRVDMPRAGWILAGWFGRVFYQQCQTADVSGQ
jgi:hypothetical protein